LCAHSVLVATSAKLSMVSFEIKLMLSNIQRRISEDFKVKLAEITCQAIEFQFNSMPKYLNMSLMKYFIVAYNFRIRKVNKNKTASFWYFLIHCLKNSRCLKRYL